MLFVSFIPISLPVSPLFFLNAAMNENRSCVDRKTTNMELMGETFDLNLVHASNIFVGILKLIAF